MKKVFNWKITKTLEITRKKKEPARSQAILSSSLCLLFFFIEIRTKNICCFYLDLNSLCNALYDIEFYCLPTYIIIDCVKLIPLQRRK